MQDIRYALRQLRKTPGFAITAVLTLALGIGANAAIFTLVNSVMLQKLPVVDPKTLVRLGDPTDRNDCCVGGGIHRDGDYAYFSTNTWEQFRKNDSEFEELAAFQAGFEGRPTITRRDHTQDPAKSTTTEFVSGNYFRTFGLMPAAGRLLNDSDDVPGATMVAVMSYDTWQSQYNSDPSIVGSTFYVNTKPVTMVGIAPRGYFGDRQTSVQPSLYVPIHAMPNLAAADYVNNPAQNWLYMIGRVKPGVDLAALQAKLSVQLKQQIAQIGTYTGEDLPLLDKVHLVLAPGGAGIQAMGREYSDKLEMLMIISGIVLLIACANIANLLLARGMSRKMEMNLRTALGAKRTRIVRQLMTESLVLSMLGGIAGLAIAFVGSKMLLGITFPGSQNLTLHAAPSPEVIGFAFAVAVLTGVLFGVAPAWIAAQAEPADALRSGSRTVSGGASLLQRGLIVGQAALSLALLVGAGMFAASLYKVQHIDMKLDATNRYIIHMDPQAAGYTVPQLTALYRTMEERFHAIPGVVKVGLTNYTPMEDNNNGDSVKIEGQPLDGNVIASYMRVNSEYFDSVGTKVLQGRGIGIQDTPTSAAVAVVNEDFVKAFFKPGETVVGHRMGFPDHDSDYEIVGVVQGTSYQDVYRNGKHPMFFVPVMQRPERNRAQSLDKDDEFYLNALVVETSAPMSQMEALSRSTLSAINPNLSVVKFQTFEAQIADRFTNERTVSRLMTLFGGLALLLAMIGLYGVAAYTVARRTNEIGIRMALGAERLSVVGMILRGSMSQTVLGLAIGVPLAFIGVRLVQAQLYQMNGVSVSALASAIAVLLASASVATLIPARRAASTDPAQTLRSE